MGTYRACYILNWIYRYFAEDYVTMIGWAGGLIQTGLYCDFLYSYAKSKWYGSRLVLPGGSGLPQGAALQVDHRTAKKGRKLRFSIRI